MFIYLFYISPLVVIKPALSKLDCVHVCRHDKAYCFAGFLSGVLICKTNKMVLQPLTRYHKQTVSSYTRVRGGKMLRTGQ